LSVDNIFLIDSRGIYGSPPIRQAQVNDNAMHDAEKEKEKTVFPNLLRLD